jgi:hypothetical protein
MLVYQRVDKEMPSGPLRDRGLANQSKIVRDRRSKYIIQIQASHFGDPPVESIDD